MKRMVLGIQYDGANWQGWQSQPNGQTVQDRLERALKQFAQHDIATICAGRTDAGVHALEQVVHFDTDIERAEFSWVRGVNRYLPPSIAVRWAHPLTFDPAPSAVDLFHARFSAYARTYHYALYNHPVRSPVLAQKMGWTFGALDVEPMQIAASYLLGTHDFSAFRAAECQAVSPIKTMHRLEIRRRGDIVLFTLQANAFLQHMVRNIVGALLLIGKRKRPPDWMKSVLANCDRTQAAPTFMPDGLYLAKVDYDKKWGLPNEAATLPFLQE